MPKRFLTAVVLLAVFLSIIPSSRAQSPSEDQAGKLNLYVSPLPVSLIAKRNSTVMADLKVKNGGDRAERLRINLMKFSAFDESGRPKIEDRKPDDDYFDWVKFSEEEFDVAPGEWKTVKATFTIPDKVLPGYYYAAVFSRASENFNDPNARKVEGAVAILVLLETDSPNAKRDIGLAEFSVEKKVYEFLPANFQVRLKNTGNVHLAPRGNIFIDKGDQHDLAILDVNQGTGGYILPDSARLFTASWDEGFPVYVKKTRDGKLVLDNSGKPATELKWDFNKMNWFRWGKYTASLLMVYDDGKRDIPIEGTVEFWVIPWRLIILVLLIILFLILGIYSFLRRVRFSFSLKSKKEAKKIRKDEKKK